MTRRAVVFAALLACAAAPSPAIRPEVADVLSRYLKFSAADLNDLRKGKVVKHSVDSNAPGEMAVVGAVRVRAPVRRLLDNVRQIEQFKRGPSVLEVGRFSDPPVDSDLDRLTVSEDDFDPSDCRVGDCGVRLSADVIRRVPRETDGTDGMASREYARWFKQELLRHVKAYWSGAPGRMMSYDGADRPIRPEEEFADLLRHAPTVGALVPELPAHLLQFPAHHIEGAEDFLYWSKEKFGLAPFITVTQITIVCPSDGVCVVASKDVYSSRYIDASLGLTIASVDGGDPGAFYLVYVNRSRASALKGLFSGLRKAIAERRARGGLEDTLKTLRVQLERSK